MITFDRLSDYLLAEQERRKKLGVDLIATEGTNSLWSASNKSLAENGAKITQGTLARF
jgi:hypothetical protein